MKMLVLYNLFFLYGLYELFSEYSLQLFEENLLFIVNLSILFCLMLARFKTYKAVQDDSLIEVESELEDRHQVELERKVYSATVFIQIAFSLALTSTLVGFILLRDSQPNIVLVSFILLAVSFFSLFPSNNVFKITHPTFKLPDPKSKNYQKEYFDQFDDGEKHVMLKGLYKIYSYITWGLFLLAFALMYYSVFTGNSQLISIIGIGLLFMLIQVSFTQSLKPKKVK